MTEAKSTLKNISKWISRKKRYVQEYSLAFHLAKTCYYIGEKEIHDAVVKLYFNGSAFLQNDEHLHNNLMKSLKEMERGVAIEIAKCYYRKHFPAPEDKFNYETEVFIETTEELQYAELNIYLKEIAEDMIVEVKKENETAIHRLERPLSALVLLGTSSDEEWIINHLDDFKIQSRPDQAQLRRALECLAQFGSIKALSSIRTIAQEYSNDDSLVNVSQVAYEAICYRENLSVPENALFEFN
ncbi:hypothetical protein G7092_16780 [Mucilaginibacter sp. HC2]|uniref:hypothetical protein n=1 Tax=Mucilaginibacter inviolabilis TaxID=2714892 RepID=UPI00140AD040|nr:hypothetical protein [Mucilaginibacter inviolabilis]NHA05468.1 hypothetical protein [Mucilaginibacter inviolabilis]